MNIGQIEKNLKKLMKKVSKETFIYDLLTSYGLAKTSITRLKKGDFNLSNIEGEVLWKSKVFYKEIKDVDLHESIIKIQEEVKHDPRFIIVTDFRLLLAIDYKTNDKLDIDFEDLAKHYDFFLPWAGMEKANHVNENPADVKAADRMAKLFDAIKKENEDDSPEFSHGLNVFLSRLLFCYFAEDTNIFKEDIFTNAIASHTQKDGSDLNSYLDKLFEVLDTHEDARKNLPEYLGQFPYVNGGLFRQRHPAPGFSRRSRQMLIDAGELDWKDINPDIFGSMFQAVIDVDQRGSLGQHYTSVPNIMKVIEPLFLNELNEAFEEAKGNQRKRNLLLTRIQKIKIFDPACGSGNFLIIAYKELRKLEMKILRDSDELALSGVSLGQFYGIEIDDFAHEVAQLSLWLAEHQMNKEFFEEFGKTNPTLPLKEAGSIIHGNACRLDWEEVCPKGDGDEVYILGNPPYLGFNVQNKEQMYDLKLCWPNTNNMKFIDYIVCWFLKASQYLTDTVKFAFVTTNSICQGAQVSIIWPYVLGEQYEIYFAYPEFIWSNNAKQKAGVICSIVGIRTKSQNAKYLYSNNSVIRVPNINAFLMSAPDVIIVKRQKPLSVLPKISTGNIPYDGGHLILNTSEKELLLEEYPQASPLVFQLSGSYEFINDSIRYCLWINEEQVELANSIPPIKNRIESVRNSRINGGKIASNYAHLPYRFYMINRCSNSSIIIPRVSSFRREYIPTGFLNNSVIISDSAQAIYDPEPYVFSVINSRIHMSWVKVLAGKLKSDFRYSAVLCYNTFPFPPITEQQKQEITQCTFRILAEREKHPEKSLAQLYDPDKMPEGLREAHRANNIVIEKCYRSQPFESDEERMEHLFKLYEKMIAEEEK